MKLKDRVAVITGSASGIGRASAKEFAKEGARVVVADINLAGAQETVKQIETAGGVALAVKTDVSASESVQALVDQSLNSFGRINVLFNNAAIQVNKTVADTTVEEWNREIAINLGGVFLCSKFFMPHLRKSKGCIVNMASVNGFFVEPMCAGYCATKGAIIALTKAMAIDHGKEGIRGWPGNTLRSNRILRKPERQPASSMRSGGLGNPRRSAALRSSSPAMTLRL